MCLQTSTGHEFPVTHITLIILVTSVSHHVCLQITTLSECLVTYIALITFLYSTPDQCFHWNSFGILLWEYSMLPQHTVWVFMWYFRFPYAKKDFLHMSHWLRTMLHPSTEHELCWLSNYGFHNMTSINLLSYQQPPRSASSFRSIKAGEIKLFPGSMCCWITTVVLGLHLTYEGHCIRAQDNIGKKLHGQCSMWLSVPLPNILRHERMFYHTHYTNIVYVKV